MSFDQTWARWHLWLLQHSKTQEVMLMAFVPCIYAAMLWSGRRLKRRHGVRLGWLYQMFAVCLALYLPAIVLDATWPFLQHLGAVVVILAAFFIIALVDRYIWEIYFSEKQRIKVPKFLSELVRLIILVVTLFFVLDMGYHQTLKGLLLAPGIVAVVLGLAMQDLMGNIIAGVALQIGKPFVHGDWLLIDNRYAEVLEINWRSTRLRTHDAISIEVPNRDLAKVTIVNLNLPTKLHAMRISVNVDQAAPPTRVKDILLHATANAKGVSADPKPKVFLKDFGEYAVIYDIKFWIEDHSQYYEIADAIRTNVWYGLKRHGIRMPFPVRTVQLERPARDKHLEVQSAARVILRQQPLFKCLNDDQLDALLPRGQVIHFGLGETIIQQGKSGDSMFILVNGDANVMVDKNHGPVLVASLGSGDCFGEMSLLTGEPRSATVVASNDCEVVEISKAVLATSLKEHPELMEKLSELLAKRQMATEGIVSASEQPHVTEARQSEYQSCALDKLRAFFQL